MAVDVTESPEATCDELDKARRNNVGDLRGPSQSGSLCSLLALPLVADLTGLRDSRYSGGKRRRLRSPVSNVVPTFPSSLQQ